MLIEIFVTVFVVGFVALAAYGHVLVAQAMLAGEDGEEPAKTHEADTVVPPAGLRRAE
jgi:hypothetical protein